MRRNGWFFLWLIAILVSIVTIWHKDRHDDTRLRRENATALSHQRQLEALEQRITYIEILFTDMLPKNTTCWSCHTAHWPVQKLNRGAKP